MWLYADSAASRSHTASSGAPAGDLFGGLSTAQPPQQGSTASTSDIFGGLSLGANGQSASAAPPTGPAKQAQASSAPYDADLFGASLSSLSGPMGIPAQVSIVRLFVSASSMHVNPLYHVVC